MDLGYNRQMCTQYTSGDSLDCMVLSTGVIDLDLQGNLVILSQDSKKRRLTPLLYTDLGRPRDVKRPNVLLVIHKNALIAWYVNWSIVKKVF